MHGEDVDGVDHGHVPWTGVSKEREIAERAGDPSESLRERCAACVKVSMECWLRAQMAQVRPMLSCGEGACWNGPTPGRSALAAVSRPGNEDGVVASDSTISSNEEMRT